LKDEIEKEKKPYHRNHFVYSQEKDCLTCTGIKELLFYTSDT
jgi:hypothetical protein